MYTNTIKILLLVFVLPFIGISAENVNNDMSLESLESLIPTDAIVINCINKAIEANEEQYINMLYLLLFSDYIINPCNEIKEIWDDELDIMRNMAPSRDNNGMATNDAIYELVEEHSELFNLIFTWFKADLFSYTNDDVSDNIILLSLSILQWLDDRKTQYDFVDEWCDISWTNHGMNEYVTMATQCLLINDINEIINPNPALIRRLIGNDQNETLSERLANAKERCLQIVTKGIAIAMQTGVEFTVGFPEGYIPYLGTSVKIGLGTYFTLDGIVEAETYFTLAFPGLGVYYPFQRQDTTPTRPSMNRVIDTNTIFFRDGYSGADLMGPSFAAAVGVYVSGTKTPDIGQPTAAKGINAFAIFDWDKMSNFNVKKAYLGHSFGLGSAAKGGLFRLELQELIGNFPLIKQFSIDLTKICDSIPQINGTNHTINPNINTNQTINLFDERADWWSSTEENINLDWNIIYAKADGTTIKSMANKPRVDEKDNIIWIGENNIDSLDWESYSVSINVGYPKNRAPESYTGFIFGATDVNNAYFFGVSQSNYTLGYYDGDQTLKLIDWGKNSPKYGKLDSTISQDIKATLYANGSVALEVDEEQKCLDTKCKDNLFFTSHFISRKGSVGFRTQANADGEQSTYNSAKVNFF